MGILEWMYDHRAPVLSERAIRKYMKKGQLIESPIDDVQFQPNSVDLRLSNDCKAMIPNVEDASEAYIDTRNEIEYAHGHFSGNPDGPHTFCLRPHQFVLMSTQEVLNIPSGIIAFVQGRSSIARIGVQIEQAGLIDSGFRGTITLEMFNQSDYPILLVEGMRIAQLWFLRAQRPSFLYGSRRTKSKYQEQMAVTGSKIYQDFEPETTEAYPPFDPFVQGARLFMTKTPECFCDDEEDLKC